MDSPSEPPEGTRPANTLTSDFQTLELCDNKCLCLSHPIRGNLLWQPWRTRTVSQYISSRGRADQSEAKAVMGKEAAATPIGPGREVLGVLNNVQVLSVSRRHYEVRSSLS